MDLVLKIIEAIELLDRFQASIVGGNGFVSVIWTLRANAKHDGEARVTVAANR